MKVLLLINWREKGEWFHYRELKQKLEELDILQPIDCGRSRGRLFDFSVLLSELYVPFLALRRSRRYDVVVSWSMRMGILFGVLKRMFVTSISPRHMIHDFHINLVRKDWKYRLRMLLLKASLPGIDFFLCTSSREEAIYARMFGIPRSRLWFYPMTPPRSWLSSFELPTQDYIFAYGNSDRDYDSLVDAVDGLSTRLLILSQTYSPRKPLPPNVILITRKHFGMDLIRLIVAARIVVLPIKSSLVSAAQTAMLETMGLGRPLVVSINMATLEYARHLDTALFYDAGDREALRNCIELLLENPVYAEELGKRAREAARLLPDRHVSVFLQALKQCE